MTHSPSLILSIITLRNAVFLDYLDDRVNALFLLGLSSYLFKQLLVQIEYKLDLSLSQVKMSLTIPFFVNLESG